MEKNITWPVLVFATSDQRANRLIQQARRAGDLREFAPRVYTSDLTTPLATLGHQHWFKLLGHLYPEAVISHRSGLEARPTPAGDIFLTYKYAKKIVLAGLSRPLAARSRPAAR